ncbi:MAG: flagellar biosynthetic protein FliO [Sedimentisphaerales bacterium]|nr:flagellar biosynthetic protein FliO [Sedimentisphaerales bacterium]
MNIKSGLNVNQNIAKYTKKNFLFIAIAMFCFFVLFLYSAGANSNNITTQNQPYDSNQVSINEAKQTGTLFPNDTSFTGDSAISGTDIFYKILLSIIFVLILGAAAVFMTKKFFPNIAKLQGKEIKVVETVHLGPRKSVHLIEIGKRRFLIGSTNENIRKLADLTEFSSSMPLQEDELD